MSKKYNPKVIEKKWQFFGKEKVFEKINPSKKNITYSRCFLTLQKNTHGSFRNYTLGDVIARIKRKD